MAKSRTHKSIINSTVSLFFVFLQFVLAFYSRKIFLNHLGTEILGLNTTAVNILQFLNLAELGIGTAVIFSLYHPLHHDNKEEICEIISLQGFLYKRIATGILLFSFVVMAFFPLIFKKIDLPLWYTYASFGVLLYSSIIGYYFNYKQIILSAAQLDYKNQLYTRPWLLLKVISQIVAVQLLDHPYVWWLILEFVFSTVSAISLHFITTREFPFIKTVSSYLCLKEKYRSIFIKVKQIFFHKMAGFALNQASPLIIYGYLSLTTVALYGNYLIITTGIKTVCNAVYSSIGGGVGDLVAEGNKNKIINVFFELFSFRFVMAGVFSFGLITLSDPFINIWIGSDYIFPQYTVLIISSILFIDIERNTVDLFINAYGLFRDVWAPITEAVINLGSAILLGYFWGLNGILSGVLISLCIMVLIWKPIFLFSQGLNISFWNYYKQFFSHLLLFCMVSCPLYFTSKHLAPKLIDGWMSLGIYSAVLVILFLSIYIGLLYYFNLGIKTFIHRLYKLAVNNTWKR